MLPWIKVDVVVPQHPKLQRLEKRLGVQDGLGVAVRLWCWTATYYPDGEFPDHAIPSMEAAAMGHVTRYVTEGAVTVTDALCESGLLEQHGDRYEVHDWSLHQQAHADKAERDRTRNAERQRRFRNRVRNVTDPVTRNVTRNVTVTQSNGGEERRGEGEEKKKQKQAAKKPAAPEPSGFAAARDRLIATYLEVDGTKYLWQGAKDSEGLKRLLGLGVDLDTLNEKWRAGLRGKGWASARTVAQLAAKWNDLEVDREAATWRRLIAEADREVAGSGHGGAGEPRKAPAPPAGSGAAEAARIALQAAGGIVLGRGREAGELQDGLALERGPERG